MDDPKLQQDEINHYENLRKNNIEDNKIVLAKLMSDISDQMVKAPVKPAPVQKRRKVYQPDFIRRNPARYARVAPSRFDLPYARPRHRSGSVSSTTSSSTISSASSSSSSPASSPEKMVVRFGFFKKSNTEVSKPDFDEESDEEYSDDETPLPRNTRMQRKPRTTPDVKPVEDITEADLNMVAMAVIDKKYDSIYGTSCHQCRQKTNDMKTMCRAETCFGVRGQFCGVCLRNRYGEDAKAALLDKDWMCPPCRGICNCSFCRKKKNKSATGILIHYAREKGYHDVNSYLNSLKNKE